MEIDFEEQYYKDSHLLLTRSSEIEMEKFDKGILFISSGSIALSITLLTNLDKTITYKCVLISAWVLLFLTIALSLLNSFYAASKFQKEVKQLNSLHQRKQALSFVGEERWRIIANIINLIIFILFVVGSVLLTIFAFLNISN